MVPEGRQTWHGGRALVVSAYPWWPGAWGTALAWFESYLQDRSQKGTALAWFESYLQDRSQKVVIGDVASANVSLTYGVPQGSVLGPILFTIYTLPLGNIARNHGLKIHMYADDDQLYIFFEARSQDAAADAISQVEACVSEIRSWMAANKLKLNDEKTEVIILCSRQYINKVQISNVKVGDTSLIPSECVRNLGVLVDRTISMEEQAKAVSKAAFYQLRNIASVKSCLPISSIEKLIHAFITARLDYCNSLLHGASSAVLQRIQRVQNAAGRLLTGAKKFEHITPILRSLHWLPVRYRIDYKILLITFKSLNGIAPTYLTDLMDRYQPCRTLRSATRNLLYVPKARLATYGDRAFSVAAPRLWNSLPEDIRSATTLEAFKTLLKPHLFSKAFP